MKKTYLPMKIAKLGRLGDLTQSGGVYFRALGAKRKRRKMKMHHMMMH
jgi:hypothetical protein